MATKKVIVGIAVASTLLLIAFFLDYFSFDEQSPAPSSAFNNGRNAIWLRYLWYAGKHQPAEYTDLFEKLRTTELSYAYFHVLSTKSDGHLELRKPDEARKIVNAMRLRAPNSRPIAWVYIGLAVSDLNKPEVRKNIVSEFRWLITDCGFDGIQVDYEFAPCGAQGLLRLLEETRAAIPPDKLLSVATPMWYPGTLWGWSDQYFKEVARRCDQLAVMCYDSYLYLPRAYVWLVRQQAIHITADCAEANPKCRVILGLPTYDNQTLAHHPHSESLKNALRGVVSGLKAQEARASTFEGIALFADYTMDTREWNQYEEYWLGRQRK